MEQKVKKLLQDIEKTGFPSELRAASVFRSRNWDVEGNTYFVDLDEQKGREIDLYARFPQLRTREEPKIAITYVINAEVKKSEKPWVIFSSEKTDFEQSITRPLLYEHNAPAPMKIMEPLRLMHPSYRYPRYGRSGYIGYSGDSSTLFGTIVSSAKASIEAHRNAEEIEGIISDVSVDVIFYNPVVILNGELYESYLDSSNELSLKKVDSMPFSFHYASPKYKPESYHVDIVTLSYLEEYLVSHEICIDRLFKYLIKSESSKTK